MPRRASPRLALVAALAAAGVLVHAAAAAAAPPIRFDDGGRDLLVTAPGYALTLSKRDGALVDLVERPGGAQLVVGSNGCLWGAVAAGESTYIGGCRFAPGRRDRFSYRWSQATDTLTLAYRPAMGAAARVAAEVTLTAGASSFDLRLGLANDSGAVLETVNFPADLRVEVAAAQAGYVPTFLPGVRLGPGFFSRVGGDVETYPSRWAFADYAALDLIGGHLALSAANPPPAPLAPASIGFTHDPGGPCSGRVFCVVHAFQTWVADRTRWRSPAVRVRVGQTVEQSILGYRQDNGIDAYPSLQAKLGSRFDALVRSPLIKADLWKGLRPFAQWGPELKLLPSPALVHPVAYTPGGHDHGDPDFLPPDPRWGTTADFRAMVEQAHSLGLLVMPYTNVSWWNLDSPTLNDLPAGVTEADVAARYRDGTTVTEHYGDNYGILVSPYVQFVRDRVAALMAQWRTDVPVDCVFLDQIGARPWERDFNPAEPSPIAYDEGWLGLMAPYASQCLMAEDGWDRLAQTFVGFHGGLLLMDRENDWPNSHWGAGNWQPYPLADWLFHDKVLLYQHDLYPGTMTADPQVLTWNMAFGMMLSYDWNDLEQTLSSPWLELVGAVQHALGPYYAGQPLASWAEPAPGITQSAFGDLVVTANWSGTTPYESGGTGIAPDGFLARSGDGAVTAGILAGSLDGTPLSGGTHYLVVERGASETTVWQPIGAGTALSVPPPASWSPGQALHATAFAFDGEPIGDEPVQVENGSVQLEYASSVAGRPVARYRIEAR